MDPPTSLSQLLSNLTIITVTAASRLFLFGCNNTTVVGLDPFTKLLDERREDRKNGRTPRGLITGTATANTFGYRLGMMVMGPND
jgi:hypothetical protein